MKYKRGKNGDEENGSSIVVMPQYNYEKVLERIGFGKTQWLLLVISGLMFFSLTAVKIALSRTVLSSSCFWNMSFSDVSTMLSYNMLGMVLSTYFWGCLGDTIGRRKVLLYGTFISCGLQLALIFVMNSTMLIVLNVLINISLGSVPAALYAYISEFNTAKFRPIVVNFSAMFTSIAMICVPAIYNRLTGTDWSQTLFGDFQFHLWRFTFLITMLPGLIGGLMLLRLPESPKLLLAQKKHQAALDAIDWISKFNNGRGVTSILQCNDFTLELGEKNIILNPRGYCATLVENLKSTVALFYKPHGKNFIIGAIVIFGMYFISTGMEYLPVMSPEVDRTNGSSGCQIVDAFFKYTDGLPKIIEKNTCNGTIIRHTINVVDYAYLMCSIVQGLLLIPLGRKNVILGSLIICAVSGLTLYFAINVELITVLYYLYIIIPHTANALLYGALVELVPTKLRCKAVSVAFIFSHLSKIIVNLIIMMPLELCNLAFGIFTISLAVCALLVHYLPI